MGVNDCGSAGSRAGQYQVVAHVCIWREIAVSPMTGYRSGADSDSGHERRVKLTHYGHSHCLLHFRIAAILERMDEPSGFILQPKPLPWVGGEPRVFAFDKEDKFPDRLPSIKDARLVDVQYKGGGITTLLENVSALSGVTPGGSFQATLEHLEELSHDMPLVIVVRDADRLLADVGPALIHLITDWESFTHHASGISAMYLVLETGPRAVTNSAFHPGGVVNWAR